MVVNFVPDGKTSGMSVVKHQVDEKQQAKGKDGVGGTTKMQAGVGADGKLSKKALAKLQKKEAKKDKKAGGAATATANDDKNDHKGKQKNEKGAAANKS